jgi:prevent-host-death family protein
MIDITQDIQPVSTFKRHFEEMIQNLKQTHRPMILTVEGKAEAVIQDAGSYQRLLDLAALASAEEGIRQGLEDVKQGRTQPAKEMFEELRAEHY